MKAHHVQMEARQNETEVIQRVETAKRETYCKIREAQSQLKTVCGTIFMGNVKKYISDLISFWCYWLTVPWLISMQLEYYGGCVQEADSKRSSLTEIMKALDNHLNRFSIVHQLFLCDSVPLPFILYSSVIQYPSHSSCIAMWFSTPPIHPVFLCDSVPLPFILYCYVTQYPSHSSCIAMWLSTPPIHPVVLRDSVPLPFILYCRLDYHCTAHCMNITTHANELCQRWITELESGGNIRFLEGTPSVPWYKSCVDLVHSRFSVGELQVSGSTWSLWYTLRKLSRE